jgi:hypothetical protein
MRRFAPGVDEASAGDREGGLAQFDLALRQAVELNYL